MFSDPSGHSEVWKGDKVECEEVFRYWWEVFPLEVFQDDEHQWCVLQVDFCEVCVIEFKENEFLEVFDAYLIAFEC